MTTDPSGADIIQGTRVAGHHLSPEVMTSLRDAASKTGVDFDFLVAQASLESGFAGSAHSHRSSAAGLFQFTSGTWMRMMHLHGAAYGHAELVKQIKPHANGTFTVADAHVEKQILDLRKDVGLSAVMAAEYAKTNAGHIEAVTGQKASAADLHLAHLLGTAGAVRFLKAREHNERQPAASVVPAAARQNPNLFYAHGSRTPQSVATVYQRIQERIDVPMRQVAEVEHQQLRPALGISEDAPQPRTDRRA
jgi:hypothetical protein